MNHHHQRGNTRVLILAVLVLVSLSGLARCDIEAARGQTSTTTDSENPHEPCDAIGNRRGDDRSRPAPV